MENGKLLGVRLEMAAVQKRTFNIVFKLRVIDYASQYSNRAAAQIHGIDEKRVCKWKKQGEELENLLAKKKHL